MITGLQVDFSSSELTDHLNVRADHHAAKAKFYSQQADALVAGGVAAQQNMSNDPVSSLRRSETEHQQKAAFFQVMAEHVIPNETYRLSESDLARVEIFSRFF